MAFLRRNQIPLAIFASLFAILILALSFFITWTPSVHTFLFYLCCVLVIGVALWLGYQIRRMETTTKKQRLLQVGSLIVIGIGTVFFMLMAWFMSVFSPLITSGSAPFDYKGKTYYFVDFSWLDPAIGVYEKTSPVTMKKISDDYAVILGGVVNQEAAEEIIDQYLEQSLQK